jgi:hypothetical protein
MISEYYSLSHRALRAALILVANVVLWIAIPIAMGNLLSRGSTQTPLSTPAFIYAFGAVITGLQVLAALTQGMAISVPFNSGSYVAEAYYIWAATDGGKLAVTSGGNNVVFSFVPILYLLILPLLFNAVMIPMNFLLEQSEVARPLSDTL